MSEMAAVVDSLAKDVASKYLNSTGFTTSVLRQMYQAALDNNGKIELDGKTYGSGQADEFIAQMESWKQKQNAGGLGFGVKINAAVGVLLQGTYPSMSGAVGASQKSTPITKEEEQRFDAIMHKLGHLQEEINTDIDTDLTSIIKDSGLVVQQLWDLVNNGVLDKKQVLVNIENACRAAGTGLHIGVLGDNLAIADNSKLGRTEGVAEAQLAMGIAATLTGIIGAIQSSKDMTTSQKADTALGATISAQNSALAFLLLMSGRVSAADAVPIHDAVMVITMVNVGLSIARKGVAGSKEELYENIGKEVLKGLPHIAGRLTSTIGTLTGNAASVSASVPVMAALTLISNEIIHQREMQKADVKNESTKEQHLTRKEAVAAEASEMKTLTEMVYRAFKDQPAVLTQAREMHEDYVSSRLNDLFQSSVDTARVTAGYQGDIQKRAVARGIEVANVAVSIAAAAFPPAQLGMIVTGALSLSMSVAGNRIIETTANNNFNIPSLLSDAILISDVNSANKIIASKDIEKFYQPNIVLMNEVVTPGHTIIPPKEAVAVLLERAKDLTQYNLAFPEEVNKEHGTDFVGDLQSWREKMEFMQALKDKIGIGGVDTSSTNLYAWINNLDQIMAKLDEQGKVLLQKYENEVVKMTGGADQELEGNIAYLRGQYSQDQLKIITDFKQQTPEAFYQNNKHKMAEWAAADSVLGGALVTSESYQETAKAVGIGGSQQVYAQFAMKMYDDLRAKIEACTVIQENLDPGRDQLIKNHELLLKDFQDQMNRLERLVSNADLRIDPEFSHGVDQVMRDVQAKYTDLANQIRQHNLAIHENRLNTFNADPSQSAQADIRKPLQENQQAIIVERGKYNAFAVLASRKNIQNAMEMIIKNPGKSEIVLEGLLDVNRNNINDATTAKAINDRMVGLSRAVDFIKRLNEELTKYNTANGTSYRIANIDEKMASYQLQFQILVDAYKNIMTGDRRDLTMSDVGKLKNFKNNLQLFVNDVCSEVGNKTLFGQLAAFKAGSLSEDIQSLGEISSSSDSGFRTAAHDQVGDIARDFMQNMKRTEIALEHPDIIAALGDKSNQLFSAIRNIEKNVTILQDKLPDAADLSAIHSQLDEYRKQFADIVDKLPVTAGSRVVQARSDALSSCNKTSEDLLTVVDIVRDISKELIALDQQQLAEQRTGNFVSRTQRTDLMDKARQRELQASNQSDFMQNSPKQKRHAPPQSERERRLRDAGAWSRHANPKTSANPQRAPANDPHMAVSAKTKEPEKTIEPVEPVSKLRSG